MTPKCFHVGQELVFVGSRHNGRNPEPTKHVVVSIGRKWVIASRPGAPAHLAERFDPTNMLADGGHYSSPGRYFMTIQEYNQELERDLLWRSIRSQVGFNAPTYVTTDEMKQFVEALRRKP